MPKTAPREIPPEPLSRRERRRLEIRERILSTAQTLFEAQGYETTTVHEIAERADVAYGTFFRHFPTKIDVLRDLSDQALRDLFVDVEGIRKQPGSFTEHFITLFEGTAERADEMGPNVRDLLRVMLSTAYPETAVQDDERMRSAFRTFMEDGARAGELREDVDLETLIEIAIGTWYSMFRSWAYSDAYPLRERAASAGRFLAQTLTKTATPTSSR